MTEIDWSGIRAAAVALGSVRDAAMRASSNLPADEQITFVERVNKRAYRERWLDEASKLAENGNRTVSKLVQNGADTLARTLADDSNHTRVGFSKAARTVATGLADKTLRSLTDRDTAQSARQWTEIAGKVHGWDAKQDGAGVNVAVNIGIIGS